MTDSMPSAAYRRLLGLVDPDAQTEMSAADYNALRRRETANGLLPNVHSSCVETETPAKTEFGEWLKAVSPHPIEAEYLGIPDRQFRFDWAIPALMVAFEYDGVIDHASRKGAWRDAEKGNLAQLSGWLFVRVNAKSLSDGSGYSMAERAFALRTKLT